MLYNPFIQSTIILVTHCLFLSVGETKKLFLIFLFELKRNKQTFFIITVLYLLFYISTSKTKKQKEHSLQSVVFQF